MSQIGKELLERLHSFGVKNELGEMEFPEGTAAQMTFEICIAIAKLDERIDAIEATGITKPIPPGF
ncbi:hypothetical protein Y710_07010 [Gordonia sp. QH-12]|nr:hypothetical protein Y710_07010 [Gordonia sp. QH-12]